jgi:hypothetical protein
MKQEDKEEKKRRVSGHVLERTAARDAITALQGRLSWQRVWSQTWSGVRQGIMKSVLARSAIGVGDGGERKEAIHDRWQHNAMVEIRHQ